MKVYLNKYPLLEDEIRCIAKSWSYDFLDCLRYIYDNRREAYEGTQLWKQFVDFTSEVGILSGKMER
jgi:hypothetical protein